MLYVYICCETSSLDENVLGKFSFTSFQVFKRPVLVRDLVAVYWYSVSLTWQQALTQVSGGNLCNKWSFFTLMVSKILKHCG